MRFQLRSVNSGFDCSCVLSKEFLQLELLEFTFVLLVLEFLAVLSVLSMMLASYSSH